MARTPERKFRDKVVTWLKQLPNIAIFSIQQKALKGTPDLLCCVNGTFVALELKSSEKAKVSALQNFYIEYIKRANGVAMIVFPENWDKVKLSLEVLSK